MKSRAPSRIKSKITPIAYLAMAMIAAQLSPTSAQGLAWNQFRPGILSGLGLGLGVASSEQGTVSSRILGLLEIHAFPHLNFSPEGLPYGSGIQLGVLGEYRLLTQFANPDASRIQMRGNGYLVGVGAGWSTPWIAFLISYDFIGTHGAPSPDVATVQPDLTYINERGFHLMVTYQWTPDIALNLAYARSSFGQVHPQVENWVATELGNDRLVIQTITLGTRFNL